MQQSDRFLRRCSQCKHSGATGFYTLNNKTGHGRERKKGKKSLSPPRGGGRKERFFSPPTAFHSTGVWRRDMPFGRGGDEDRTFLLPLLWKVGALIMMSAFSPPPLLLCMMLVDGVGGGEKGGGGAPL